MNKNRISFVDLDMSGKICQSVRMFYPIRKFIAVIMAIWLPLFGDNALAESIAMHAKGGSCHAVPQQQNGHHSHQASAPHQHMHQAHFAANPDLSSSHQDQQNSSCKDHAICHLACCGYVAGSVSLIVAPQQADRNFAPYLDAPRTLTLPLFDPPPITRA